MRGALAKTFRFAAARVAPKAPLAWTACNRPQFAAPAALSVHRFMSTSFIPKAEVSERVLKVVKNFQNVDASKVTPTSHFQNDLGLDSLDTVEMVMAFEDEFAIEIPDAEADKILTVAAAIDYVASHPQAK